jgi:hypothetical protein
VDSLVAKKVRIAKVAGAPDQVGDAEKELAGAGGQNVYATLVDEAEGLDKIEDLQNHENEEIYDKARARPPDVALLWPALLLPIDKGCCRSA